jgi:hypothetical protein
MGVNHPSSPKWHKIDRLYLDTFLGSLFIIFISFIISMYLYLTLDMGTIESWGTTGAYILSFIIVGVLTIWFVFGFNEIKKEIGTWRSMKGMRYCKLSIPSERLNKIINKNLSRQDVTIEPFDVPRWKDQLYLSHSYIIRCDGETAFLLIGDYSEEGKKKPDVNVFIGPFTKDDHKFKNLLEMSVISF